MLDPETQWYLTAALWTVAVGWSLWTWLPLALAALTGGVYENGGEENPAAVEPDGTDPDYTAVFDELRDLGYEPIGPGFMRVRFHDWFWAYRTRVEAFRSRAAGRFAFVQQHPFPLAGYHEVFFATCFKDGGLLITGGGSKVSNQTGNLVIRSWPTLDLYELEDGHQDAVEELIERGWQLDPDLSLETLLRATRENRHTRDAQIGCFILLGMVVVFQAGLVTLISVETGLWHWLPALAAIGVVAFVRTGGYMLQHNRAQELIRRAREARKGEPSD